MSFICAIVALLYFIIGLNDDIQGDRIAGRYYMGMGLLLGMMAYICHQLDSINNKRK